ncbi:MAG: diaminopimelate epimerase [Rickettsiaceae bacterium]|nr:diaminopimelate epimerase [Rickettsiaceae bacterium]
MDINFTKMQGLGNDFVIIDSEQLKDLKLEDLVKKIADRRLGIGCDQVIIYKLSSVNECEMMIYNTDGSRAEACGNGTRCLAKLICDDIKVRQIDIKVGTRILKTSLQDNGEVLVNMGAVSFEKEWMISEEQILEIAKIYNLNPREIICVDIANPHLVIFSSDLGKMDRLSLAKKLSSSEFFPQGVNIDFAHVDHNNIQLNVWERGVGFTLACGSGACATFAAAAKLSYIDVKKTVTVQFTLGHLNLTFDDQNNILMSGKATLVAKGGSYCYEQ